jgi:hypothetical protein
MGQRVILEKYDDLDGTTTEEVETIEFSIDRKSYTIDLAPHNATALRELLAPYVKAGKRGGSRSTSRSGASKQADPRLQKVREWARANGIEVSDRGLVAQHIIDAYEAAQSGQAAPPSASASPAA